jgi:hypothetical protein
VKGHRLTSTALFVAAVLGYFLAEAVLRRTVYYVPQGSSASSREALLRYLPDFLQSHFKELQKIADLEAKIEKSTDVAQRRQLLYELSGLVKERKSLALLSQIIEEDPASPETVNAWARVLPTLSEKEIYDRYTAFIARCDIRTQADKIKVWQTGLNALAAASSATRGPYVRQMAEARVVSSALIDVYELLWSESVGRGDTKTAELADELRRLCRETRQREIQDRQLKR